MTRPNRFAVGVLLALLVVLASGSSVLAQQHVPTGARAHQGDSGALITPNRDGANAQLVSADGQPVGFSGYIKDTETGLYYARARYYDPATARFITEDPEAGKDMVPPSLHRYLYAYANPTVYVDPTGRESSCFSSGPANNGVLVGCGLSPNTPEIERQTDVAFAGLVTTVLAVPLAIESASVGAAAWTATRVFGWRWGLATATTQGAPVAEAVIGTAAAITSGAQLPPTPVTPLIAMRPPSAAASIEATEASTALKSLPGPSSSILARQSSDVPLAAPAAVVESMPLQVSSLPRPVNTGIHGVTEDMLQRSTPSTLSATQPYQACFGAACNNNYKATFFAANPETKGKVVVHHAVEQQTLKRQPDVVTESEIHSLENLRGIPNELNSDIHLSKIRIEWNEFYRRNPNATKQELLDKATEIDLKYGRQFNPPVGPAPPPESGSTP